MMSGRLAGSASSVLVKTLPVEPAVGMIHSMFTPSISLRPVWKGDSVQSAYFSCGFRLLSAYQVIVLSELSG